MEETAGEFYMTPVTDSEPVHMVDGGKNFCDDNVDRIIKRSAELSAPGAPYAVISIVGAQSSGKSYLLNRLFGTRFPEMDATRGWSQTTRGIMMSRCIEPSLLLLDVEGFDGMENGQDTLFENQAALFALTVSDLMIVNMKIDNIGLEKGGGSELFRTIFQERTKIKGAGLTKILVVLRDYDGKTPLEILRSDVLKRLQKTWDSANMKSKKFKDYIEVDTFGMPYKESSKFPEQVTVLRQLLSKNRSAKVPASSFTKSSRIFWDTIKQNKKLDIPSHQVLVASLYCRRLVQDTLNSLDSLEDYKLLKVEESPSRFKKIAYAILEDTKTKYNKETEMYDHDTRAKESQYMVEELLKIFTEDSKELIWKMKKRTLDHYKVKLDGENIKSMKEDEADSHGNRIVVACVENFMSLCEDLKVFDSEYLRRTYEDLKKQLQSDTDLHIQKIKGERERKERERIMAASLGLKVTDTLLNLGGLVVNGCNTFSGHNGNGSG